MDNLIKVVIFDLGNVIARVDFERTVSGMGRFLNAPLDSSVQKEIMTKIAEYERGGIESRDFLTFLQETADSQNPLLPSGVPSLEVLRDIWNSMITDLPGENLQCIGQVKTRYTTCLLSNTNELHMEYVRRLHGGFESLFDKIYLSCRMKLSKPEPEIYRAVLHDLGIPAQECLFIDDRAENIEGARSQGIKGILLNHFELPMLFTPEGELSEYAQKLMAIPTCC